MDKICWLLLIALHVMPHGAVCCSWQAVEACLLVMTHVAKEVSQLLTQISLAQLMIECRVIVSVLVNSGTGVSLFSVVCSWYLLACAF
jgi:hypothetical protein